MKAKRKSNPHHAAYLFVVIHDDKITWRTDSGLMGSDPYTKLSEVETLIFNLKKRLGLTKNQVEIRNDRTKKNPSGVRIVHNKLLGGWYVVRGPHQTPLNGRFNSKAEAETYLFNSGLRAPKIKDLLSVRKNPDIHIDIHSHNTKGRNVRAKNPDRVTRKWLDARVKLLSELSGLPLSFESNNPGDYRRYTVTNPEGSHNYSPSLKAGEIDIWLTGAIAAFRELVSGGRKSNPRKKNPGGAFKKGERVQLHAATDDWMRGDRYGEVLGYGRKAKYRDRETGVIFELRPVRVKLDKSGKVKRFHPDNVLPL